MAFSQTQAQETQSLTPADTCLFAKLMAAHSEIDGSSIMLTVAFTPGSLSLSAYALTPKGFEWGRNADPNTPTGYNPASMVDRCQLLLSDRILGSTFGGWRSSVVSWGSLLTFVRIQFLKETCGITRSDSELRLLRRCLTR